MDESDPSLFIVSLVIVYSPNLDTTIPGNSVNVSTLKKREALEIIKYVIESDQSGFKNTSTVSNYMATYMGSSISSLSV